MANITEADIHREAIIGFLVIKDCTGAGNYCSVCTEPIYVWYDGLENNITIDKDQTIIGVLPAPAEVHRVYW